ncbi:hypothetical protein D3C81_11090 [compost metagenome]
MLERYKNPLTRNNICYIPKIGTRKFIGVFLPGEAAQLPYKIIARNEFNNWCCYFLEFENNKPKYTQMCYSNEDAKGFKTLKEAEKYYIKYMLG